MILFACECETPSGDSDQGSPNVASGGRDGSAGSVGAGGRLGSGGLLEPGHSHGSGGASASGGTSATGGSSGNTGGTTGGSPGVDTVNGCVDFVDRSALDADRAISWNFDVASDIERCLTIRAGQQVRWTGNFSMHPLQGNGGDSPNPIGEPAGGDTLDVTFSTSGMFGYICDQHVEMRGAIQVLPPL